MINGLKRILLKIYNFGYFPYPRHLGVPESNIPFRRIFLAVPLTWLCFFMDKIFFKNNLRRNNPDTVGWVIIARKNEDIND